MLLIVTTGLASNLPSQWQGTELWAPTRHVVYVSMDNSQRDPDDTIETSWIEFTELSIESYAYAWDEDLGNSATAVAHGETDWGISFVWTGSGTPLVVGIWGVHGSGYIDLTNPPAEAFGAGIGAAACTLSDETAEISFSQGVSSSRSIEDVGRIAFHGTVFGLSVDFSVPVSYRRHETFRDSLSWTDGHSSSTASGSQYTTIVSFAWMGALYSKAYADGSNGGILWDIGEVSLRSKIEARFMLNGLSIPVTLTRNRVTDSGTSPEDY